MGKQISEGFNAFINKDRAIEILEAIECCESEGIGGDLSFFLSGIKHAFPDLAEGRYRHIFNDS